MKGVPLSEMMRLSEMAKGSLGCVARLLGHGFCYPGAGTVRTFEQRLKNKLL